MIRNPLAWCLWALAALAAAFIDRNPYLQGLLLLVLANVWLTHRRQHRLPIRLGLALALIPILFSAALSRFGAHAFLALPGIPIIGGRWTWEAVVFGASSGMAILLTVGIFAVLQATVRSADLVSLLPRPFYRAGTAFALSLAFAPKTMGSFQSIVEARRLRGVRTGWRAAPSVLVPLLLTTLEQALQYGESLDARGYGNHRRSRYRPVSWSIPDVIAAITAAIGLAMIVTTATAAYNPYAQLTPAVPSFAPVIGVLLLASPAILGLALPENDAAH